MIDNSNAISLHIMDVDNQMVLIHGGKIEMRDDRIKKQWAVEIDPFFLARYPVTQYLYKKITKESPSTFKGSKLPVESVSWKDAVNYCNLLSVNEGLDKCYSVSKDSEQVIFNVTSNGYRLPTEAEWLYACKAGTEGTRYGDLDFIAWYKDNSEGTTHDVGQKTPNPWGLYDMLGNVWEWCSDIYDEEVYGSYRVLRGGGWSDGARGCMATNRRRSHPTSFKIDDLGFRVAKNLPNIPN